MAIPLDLSPVLWLDASDAATITSSGGAVSQWSDKSGNGNHATQSTGASKPTTGTRTQNGLNVLDFDGGDFLQYATSLQGTGAGALTIFVVALRDTSGTLLTERTTGQSRAFQFYDAGSSNFYISSDGVNGSSNHQIDTPTMAITSSPFYACFESVSGSRIALRLNGSAGNVTSGTATNLTGGTGGLIACRESGNGQNWDGWIGEIIAFDYALTSTERGDVESYLNDKWFVAPSPTGTADAAWSGWTATATGVGATTGTATASWSGWTATATVPEATTGTADAAWSGWSATILVDPPAGTGTATASWGGWSATIAGPGQTISGGTAESAATVPGGGVNPTGTTPAEWAIQTIDPATSLPTATTSKALDGTGWEDVWSDLGGGVLKLPADNTLGVTRGDVIRCTYRGAAAFQWRATRSVLTRDDDGPGTITWSGPGRLADLTAARVTPSRGFGASPVEEVRSFGWPAVDYDDSYWGDLSMSLGPQGTPTAYWYGLGDWPDPSAEWMWAPGAATNYAPTGDVYFRTTFTVTTAGWHTIHLAVDDRGALWLDGQRLLTTQSWDNSNNSIVTVKVVLSAGEHTLAVWGNNNPGEVGNNPAGVLVAVMPEAGGPSIFNSGAGWRCLAYPLVPPGVTFGHAAGIVLQEAQDRGLLTGLAWEFTDTVDSNGDPWPYLDDVTAKVGTDLWSLIKAHVGIDCQVHMPGAAYRLDLYVPDGGGPERAIILDRPTDPTDPDSGVLVGQTNTAEGVIATAAVVRWDAGWLYIDTTPDGTEPEEVYLELRHITSETEAERVARGVLADLGRVREQIEVGIDPLDGELPWHQWTVGDIISARDTAGSLVAERVVGIAATLRGDYIEVTPTLKDRILEDFERHEEWLKAMSDGAARGNTTATTPPSLPPPSMPPRSVKELTWSMDTWAASTGGRHEFNGRVTCRRWRLHLDAAATGTVTATLQYVGGATIATASVAAGGTDDVVIVPDVIDNGEAVEVVTTGSESFGGNVTLEYLAS